jgi:hypothetical protein
MTPRPIGLKVLGVETHPYELSNLGCRYWFVDGAMFDSLKLLSLTHVTSTGPIASMSVDF